MTVMGFCGRQSDSTAAFTDEEHAGALNTFMLFFGEVMSTKEVIQRMTPVADRRSGDNGALR
jgi:hypothetical protein